MRYKNWLSKYIRLQLCVGMIALAYYSPLLCRSSLAQDTIEKAQTIIVYPGPNKPLPLLYSASLRADVTLNERSIEQSIELKVRVVQGKSGIIRLGLSGMGEVVDVQAESLISCAIRTVGSQRFLDLQIGSDVESQPEEGQPDENESDQDQTEVADSGERIIEATVRLRSNHTELPVEVDLLHLTPGSALGLDSQFSITESSGVTGRILKAEGFAPLVSEAKAIRLQTATGGLLRLRLDRPSSLPPPVELVDTSLKGQVHKEGHSIQFRLNSTARVTAADARLPVFSGNLAISRLPTSSDYRLVLSEVEGNSVYEIVFYRTGEFQIDLEFDSAIRTDDDGWQAVQFGVVAGTVVPMQLEGLGEGIEFSGSGSSMVLLRSENNWQGFLPASGSVQLRWRSAQTAGEGKLFFTTSAESEAIVSTGLLRQTHRIDYQILQGQLKSLTIRLNGPGEILGVQGKHVVGWEIDGDDGSRDLEITLNQPLSGKSQLVISSQSSLGSFPTQVEGLCLQPIGAIRHSGFLFIKNSGSVRIEPTDLRGLTQVASEPSTESSTGNNQAFAFRFPSADYGFSVLADRVQPEINVTQLVVYQLSEADRVIMADVELDIRQAPIRHWDILIPESYSIVSVTGAGVAEYIAASESSDSLRNVKILFSQEVQGRQLISVRLEENTVATAGSWMLPSIQFPEAKSVRGDIGIAVAPGYRATVSSSNLLVEKPLSYFPKTVPNLQHAFRMREPGWTATMEISLLDRSVQSDAFHLVSLSQGTIYGSALINYIVTGAPVSEWLLEVPAEIANVTVDGPDIRSWRRDGSTLVASLHQPVMGAYTLLLTFESKPNPVDGSFQVGLVAPQNVQGEHGYIEVVSPVQVDMQTVLASSPLLVLDPLELPAEFRLMSSAPSLGTWQYTERPFELRLKVNWFEPGETATQVVEYSEANSRVSADGELVTDVLYYVKSRGQQTLRLQLPNDPVRLWAASVNNRPVSARQADTETLIPLPGNADPNTPVEVRLRLGKMADSPSQAILMLPTVFAPVLKTQWNIKSDENHLLLPARDGLQPVVPVYWPNGFDWLTARKFIPLAAVVILCVVSFLCSLSSRWIRVCGMLVALVATAASAAACLDAWLQIKPPEQLQLSLPVLASGQIVELNVQNLPVWRAAIVWPGIALLVAGIGAILIAWQRWGINSGLGWIGLILVALGCLVQPSGATWFFGTIAFCIFVFQFLVEAVSWWTSRPRTSASDSSATSEPPENESTSVVVTSLLLYLFTGLASLTATFVGGQNAMADEASERKSLGLLVATESGKSISKTFCAADSLTQQWLIESRQRRLTARAELLLTGRPGDEFKLLEAPAIITKFQGGGLRLQKISLPNSPMVYVVTIEAPKETDSNNPETDSGNQRSNQMQLSATFEYQLNAIQPTEGIGVLTGRATFQQIEVEYDEPSWEVACSTAAHIESLSPKNLPQNNQQESTDENTATAEDTATTNANQNQAVGTTARSRILLGQGETKIVLRPPARDLSSEQTQFFVESSGLYIPAPGVVDGKHRFDIRTSQGQVQQLKITIPTGLTVSSVDGPVESWQFDAELGRLSLQMLATAPSEFSITVGTQRSLEPLPVSLELSPLRVSDAQEEVGLIAVAFASEAQPENSQFEGLTPVNLGDFDPKLLPNEQTILHQVFRFGKQEAKLRVQISSVAPDVRVESKEVLSFGDERIVLAINFLAEITRTGLFQLSFPLPDGLEVESLTGESLHHWSEVMDQEKRQIVMHLNGKTIGAQQFSLTMAGATPVDVDEWDVPRFELNEAKRQSGELAVQPATGIRLRAVSRQNVSEADPRLLGAQIQGSLAFRTLQKDWSLRLGIDKLEAWVTGQILHEVVLREGQTRSTLMAEFNIQNSAVRSLAIELPTSDEEELKTVRASGEAISDFVRSEQNNGLWVLQFKRRIIGNVTFQIEYQRRGERSVEGESIRPIAVPESRQTAYYFAVRTGGRLEVEPTALSAGWQRIDWSSIPQTLREAGNRNSPGLALRALSPPNPLKLQVVRHSLAESLKLRVATGKLTTVLSPTGDQLTAVELTMEVVQRSNLSVQLAAESELFSIFVNGESVHSIRQTQNSNVWQFTILPGLDDRTAQVRFVYSLSGSSIKNQHLVSPQLNVPLENIQWDVIAPNGYQLTTNDGNLELVGKDNRPVYDLKSYLSISKGKLKDQAQQATELLEQANQLLQTGEQTKARWAFNNLANRYALDAASNEDARVQLENLQTQQAVVGLNTRRQRLFLDNSRGGSVAIENEQLKQAASANPILKEEQMNYRPQEISQLLAGNTQQDNAILQQIAGRLVQHQRSTEPAPQAIQISLPEEGNVYSFRRAVQVAENAPLELKLQFHSKYRLQIWQWIVLACLLAVLTITVTRAAPRSVKAQQIS